jgi:hypothetical protein
MRQDSGDDDGHVVVIPINHSFSDGDPSTWPTEERFGRPDDSYYRQKLAELWLKETGAYASGKYGISSPILGVSLNVTTPFVLATLQFPVLGYVIFSTTTLEKLQYCYCSL